MIYGHQTINGDLSTGTWGRGVNVDNAGEARKLFTQSLDVNPGLDNPDYWLGRYPKKVVKLC